MLVWNLVDCYLHSCKGNNNSKWNFYVQKVHISQLLIHQERWKGQKSCSAVKMTRLWIFSKNYYKTGLAFNVIFKAHPTYYKAAHYDCQVKYILQVFIYNSSVLQWGFLPWPVNPIVENILLLLRAMQPFLTQTFIGWMLSWSKLYLYVYLRGKFV